MHTDQAISCVKKFCSRFLACQKTTLKKRKKSAEERKGTFICTQSHFFSKDVRLSLVTSVNPLFACKLCTGTKTLLFCNCHIKPNYFSTACVGFLLNSLLPHQFALERMSLVVLQSNSAGSTRHTYQEELQGKPVHHCKPPQAVE